MVRHWLFACTCLAGMPAMAQPRAEPAADTAVAADPELVVTATRRQERGLSVAAAVTALSPELLDQAAVRDTQDLARVAPGLVITTAASEATAATIRLRGIGTSGTNLGLEGSVGVFVDGVYRARSGIALSELYDLAQVEVLRGPQGTLFGKNTTAGALLVQTRAPSYDWQGEAGLAYGNFDFVRVTGAVGGPIVDDRVAFRLAGVFNWRDGYLTDAGTGRQANDRNRFALRGQLRLDPSETVSIRLIADYSRKNEECCAATVIANGTRSPIIAAMGGFVPTRFDDYTTASNSAYRADTSEWGLSAQADVTFGNTVWTSILSWRDFRSDRASDGDFTNLDLLNTPFEDTSDRFFTAETTLKGKAGPVDWLIGGFYFDQRTRQDSAIVFGRDLAGFFQRSFPAQSALLATLYPVGGGDTRRSFGQDATGWSLFTHNIIGITSRLKATIGARYLEEDKAGFGQFAFNSPACGRAGVPAGAQQLCPTPDFTSLFNDSALVGSAALQWEPSANTMIYASVSRGYKAGGLNLDRTGGLAGAAGSTFLPEEVDSYEFGAKGRFLDGRARLALTLFSADIRNFQQNAFNGIAFTISNAAAVRSRGLELEATLRPARWFTFNTSLVYNEAIYGNATEAMALRGRQIVNAPRWTWQSQLQIDQPIGARGWTAQFSANARLLSDINTSVSLLPQAEQDAYMLLGGRLGLRSPGGRWDISAFVQNLTNQYYRTIVFAGVIQPGTFNAYVGEPRTFGLEARMRF